MRIITLLASFLVAAGITTEAAIVHGPVMNPSNGHSYYLLGEDTWQNAEAEAVSMGGHLATIRNQVEQDWVFSTFASYGGTVRSLWIGLREVGVEGNYQWVSGEPRDYTHWAPGEPNNGSGTESYVQMVKANNGFGVTPGAWNDISSPTNPEWPYYDPVHGVVEICVPHKAKATAQLVDGSVAGATITDSGCGYTNAPVIQIQGGGGNGATARAEITDGRVTSIIITDAGIGYETPPRFVIASPPFVPTVSISVSMVKVVQNVVLGRKYVLESSQNAVSWTPALPPFTATSESITNEFNTDLTGRYFRVRETP